MDHFDDIDMPIVMLHECRWSELYQIGSHAQRRSFFMRSTLPVANMSFFMRRSTTSSRQNHETQQSELERLRGRQLASLVRAGGRAKNHAQTTFDVPVTETQRGPLFLTVTLSQDFPMRAPHVQTSFPVHHPWLDLNGTVQSHPDLIQWTAHSDLGRILSEIVAELQRQATQLAATQQPQQQQQQQQQQQSQAYPAPYQYPTPGAQPPPAPTPSPPPPPHTPKNDPPQLQRSQMPVIPAIFPELEDLSVAQLENLSNDRHALKAFVRKIESVKEFLRLREEVLNGNISIAEKTLSYEEKLRGLQSEVTELRSELQVSQTTLAEKQARQQRIVARHRPDALLEQLAAATRALDESSDEMASQFTHGDMDFPSFVSQYIPQRTLYHQRTLKLNRVMQQ